MIPVGQTPIGFRQESAAAFSGAPPKKAADLYEPFAIPVTRLTQYVLPTDQSLTALDQCGLFDFGAEQTIRILEIRGLTALGNISAIVTDRGDIKTADLTVGGATPAIDLVATGVIPGDIVTVTSPGPVVETYTVAQVDGVITLQTDEIISERDLVAADLFSIKSANGTVTRYAHTLAGADTLDIDVATTHDVLINTPAASRILFVPPVVIAPSQVLKISTVSADAAGWLDVYAVKGDWF